MSNTLNIIYNNINSFNNKSHLIYNYIQNNNIDCGLFVETKLKNFSSYQDWNILHKPGNIVNRNTRGGSLVMTKKFVRLGKANPPKLNNPANDCLHFTAPFKKDKLHIFLVYVHPESLVEATIFVKASLYDNAIIIGDFNVNI